MAMLNRIPAIVAGITALVASHATSAADLNVREPAPPAPVVEAPPAPVVRAPAPVTQPQPRRNGDDCVYVEVRVFTEDRRTEFREPVTFKITADGLRTASRIVQTPAHWRPGERVICIPRYFFNAPKVAVCLGDRQMMIQGRWMEIARQNIAAGKPVNFGQPMNFAARPERALARAQDSHGIRRSAPRRPEYRYRQRASQPPAIVRHFHSAIRRLTAPQRPRVVVVQAPPHHHGHRPPQHPPQHHPHYPRRPMHGGHHYR